MEEDKEMIDFLFNHLESWKEICDNYKVIIENLNIKIKQLRCAFIILFLTNLLTLYYIILK
jgi:hypothetical protein